MISRETCARILESLRGLAPAGTNGAVVLQGLIERVRSGEFDEAAGEDKAAANFVQRAMRQHAEPIGDSQLRSLRRR